MIAAAVQFSPALGDVTSNTARMEHEIREAARDGADLVVFPEAALTGYVFESAGEARRTAVDPTGSALERLARITRTHALHAVCPAIEADGDRLFNTAFLLGPDGLIGRYRKVHTLCLGVDRFTWPGDLGFPVFDTSVGRLGLHICYDASFPESARALRAAGAQVLILPTNWPRLVLKRSVVQVRAYENHAWYLAVNRVGVERGVRFEGGSMAAAPSGRLVWSAGAEEGRFLVELDPEAADDTREIVRAGEYELDLIADRRPDTYRPLVDLHATGRPTGGQRRADPD